MRQRDKILAQQLILHKQNNWSNQKIAKAFGLTSERVQALIKKYQDAKKQTI